MRYRHTHTKRTYIRKHALTTIIILSAMICTGVFLYLYNAVQSAQITEHQNAMTLNTQQTHVYVTKVLADKAAKAKQAAQAAAAQAAADQSKNATATTATSIDSHACNTSTTHNNPANIDVLVNKKHCLIPLSYYPTDLLSADGAILSAKAAYNFDAMYNAAASAGQAFQVTSSYRSYAVQINTYNYWVSTSGKIGADTYSARPGYSEHQTGFAVDLEAGSCALSCFGSSTQYTWLKQHAADYGFIQRYPAGEQAITGYETEQWHYRFVGTSIAKDILLKGATTLEQYWNMSGGNY
jgi:D-alanyl-D-alanine carboxypeptidase